MAFRLKLGEPVEKGFRRIAVEQIHRARTQIAANVDPAAEIHEARKCMKRIRALLRLAREGIGEDTFKTENARFRSIGQRMAPARDDHVLIETIVKLMTTDECKQEAHALARMKAAVLIQRSLQAGSTGAGLAEAATELDRAIPRLRRMRLSPDAFATLELALVRNYRGAVARRDGAFEVNSDEAFHDWRKSVQAYWRHMALLTKAWPAYFNSQVEAARELSQILGDDHDLAILRQNLHTLPQAALSDDDRQQIESLVTARQQTLRRAAKPRGEMLFSERPKAHGRRMTAIWHSALARDREDEPAPDAKKQRRPKSAKSAAQTRG